MLERLLTPSKINAFLDCGHYLTLQHRLERGQVEARTNFGSMAQMLMAKGLTHERACLDHYRELGLSVYEVPGKAKHEGFSGWVRRVGNPMATGHDVIYQMPLAHDGIRGVADFLVRVEGADGTAHYEPVDAKLTREEAKPGHVLQLCFYADAIEALTGRAPDRLHIWLGSGQVESVGLNNVRAYWRRLRKQLAIVMATGPSGQSTTAEKCTHCAFCEFAEICEAEWRSQDSLIFVANILSSDRERLGSDGISTMDSLAACDREVAGLSPKRRTKLNRQASLQVEARRNPSSPPPFEHLAILEESPPVGFPALPEPAEGDLFLDYEGHPFWTAQGGLFFLFGLLTRNADGTWEYEARWAHDLAGERKATLELIQFLAKRREAHPGMHVYHYNHTERSALERLSSDHGVGEVELADLVQSGLFIDLLAVLTKAMQIGVESYGLKHVEGLAGFVRSEGIDQGAGAVTEYEAWCSDRDSERLERIAQYNQDDVQATLALRDWLVSERPADLPWRPAVVVAAEETDPDLEAQVEALHSFPEESAEHLLGDLLGHWRRDGHAIFSEMIIKTAYELDAQLEDPDILAGLVPLGQVARQGKGGRAVLPGFEFQFPPQMVGRDLVEGGKIVFTAGEAGIANAQIDAIDPEEGTLRLIWNKACQELGVLPTVVVVDDRVSAKPKPDVLQDLAAKILAGSPSDPPHPLAMAMLHRDLPRFKPGKGPLGGVFTDSLEDICNWAPHLDDSYVAIQGPPGTGKTYTGAHLIHALIRQGRRVGITALSHNAIDNLLAQVVEVFSAAGDLSLLRAVRKPREMPVNPLPGVRYVMDNKDCATPTYNLVGGTTWLFANPLLRQTPVDVLVIDEAGQLSLADALAAAGAARSVVLLGDPQQLPHVSKGTHPERASGSVLEHLLGKGQATIQPDRGVLLSQTWRMHPDVCQFISGQFYDGKLTSHPTCVIQDTQAGTGLRWIRARHVGCSTQSEEEATLLVEAISKLIGQSWTDAKGQIRPLAVGDVLVVAPYNDQVDLLRARLEAIPKTAGVRVGTVDKFQGQEAPVVFFTMTASNAEDVPRGLDFLFSRNRLNVAISRARALAFVVCTEELLNSRARDIDQMELISTLCAFVEESAT